MTDLGKRLAIWRGGLGQAQAAFAKQIGIHVGQLKKYEQGVTVPGGEALAAIAATGVNLNWLLLEAGPMRAPAPAEAAAAPAGEDASAPAHAPAANTSAGAVPHRYARRIQAIAGMLGNMPEPEAAALIAEFAARAQTQQQLAELRQAVHQLEADRAKRA